MKKLIFTLCLLPFIAGAALARQAADAPAEAEKVEEVKVSTTRDPEFKFYRPLASLYPYMMVKGARLELDPKLIERTKGRAFTVPMFDQSIPDDTLVQFEFAEPAV